MTSSHNVCYHIIVTEMGDKSCDLVPHDLKSQCVLLYYSHRKIM